MTSIVSAASQATTMDTWTPSNKHGDRGSEDTWTAFNKQEKEELKGSMSSLPSYNEVSSRCMNNLINCVVGYGN